MGCLLTDLDRERLRDLRVFVIFALEELTPRAHEARTGTLELAIKRARSGLLTLGRVIDCDHDEGAP